MAKKTDTQLGKIEREYVIPLRAKYQHVPRYKKTPKAIKEIKIFLARHMRVRDRDLNKIKLDKLLNEYVWARGIKNPVHKVHVKAIKDDKTGMVQVELVNLPNKLKFKKLRQEKISTEAKKIVDKKQKEKVEVEKKETVEEKKTDEKSDEKVVKSEQVQSSKLVDADISNKEKVMNETEELEIKEQKIEEKKDSEKSKENVVEKEENKKSIIKKNPKKAVKKKTTKKRVVDNNKSA